MTPADVAMKAALDESAQYADSPPATASSAIPLMGGTSHLNVTSLGPHFGKSFDHVETSSRPSTPHITLHQFHRLQHSPAPSSPDIDYKRVRRKQSFTSLARLPSEENQSLTHHTSSSTSLARGSKSLLQSLLPPLPPTQLPQPSTYSPSLSSTVDTLQSTPTHSPIQREFWPLGPWSGVDPSGYSEPIRTKRKFLPLKQAKRLPHHSAYRPEGESTWEVHAAVIDVGLDEGDLDGLEGDIDEHVSGGRYEEALARSLDRKSRSRTSRRKGKIVRFEDSESEGGSDSEPNCTTSPHVLPADATKAPALSSSLSLSQFQFPPPPESGWEGTFGHLTEPTSPASPATLQYRGVSFDVVNPHNSLLLGVSDIETPAEIEGLLDTYFDRNDFATMQTYSDNTGERSVSQYSIQTSGSNGRQRILYDDPDSARRNIMGLRGRNPQQTIVSGGGEQSDIPPMPSTTPPSIPLPTLARVVRQRIRIHPKFSEVLGLDTEGSSRIPRYDPNYQDLEEATVDDHHTNVSTRESHYPPALAEAQDASRLDDRPNSLYPHSRRSDPFDLTLNDDEEDLASSNVYGAAAGRRTSAARVDHGADIAIYEDADDANARTQSTAEQETTVGQILSHYNYPRPTFGTSGGPNEYISPYDNASTQSTSIDLARGRRLGSNNPYASPQDISSPYLDAGMLRGPETALETSSSPNFTYARLRGAPRAAGPPARAMPTPPFRSTHGQGWSPYDPDLIATDHTYGSTGQLLRLTPQAEGFASRSHEVPAPLRSGHRNQLLEGYDGVAIALASTRPTRVPPPIEHDDEDKENTPPQLARPASTLSVTPGREPIYYDGPRRIRGPATIVNLPAHLQRSQGVRRDDDSIWESTQASESRENLTGTGKDTTMQDEAVDDVRRSEESYANTSIAGSTAQLSMPRPDAALPLPQASARRVRPAIAARTSSRLTARQNNWMPQTSNVNDEERARRILEDKMMEDAMLGQSQRVRGTPHPSQGQYAPDMKELEEIRQKNPSAVEKAVTVVTESFGKLASTQPQYTPQASASRFPAFGLGMTTPDSRYSETRGLLAEHAASPYSNRGLRFSETANAFQTTQQMPSFITSPPVQGYSPLTPPPVTPPAAAYIRDLANTPTARATRTAALHPTSRPLRSETIELQPITRRGRVSRVAMSSQTELRPLQLAESTAASGITGRLTDMQFAEAEGTWTMRPGRTENPRHALSLLRQSGDGPPNVNQLASARDVRDMPVRRIQLRFTRPYYRACIVCPVTALIFGCGGLDWRMRQMTGGRIHEMSPKVKKRALQIFVPLGIIRYTVIVLMIVLIVYIARE